MNSPTDPLEEEHNRYVTELLESGLPLWMADMYENAQPRDKEEPKFISTSEPEDELPF